jgi:hypothetical protein
MIETADFLSAAGLSNGITSSYDLNQPVIGWNNFTTVGNIFAGTADPDFPYTNMANPATHLKWKSATTSDTFILITTGAYLDYVALEGHGLGTSNGYVTISGTPNRILLHFDTPGNSPDIITSDGYVAQTWTTSGNAFKDTAQFKFGTSSLKCDGVGDYVSAPDIGSFNLDTIDFTIDLWVRPNVLGTTLNICGQAAAAGLSNADSAFSILKTSANVLQANVVSGTTVTTLTGTTTMTTGQWYHVALVRKDNLLYLFLNGALQASVAYSSTINDSTQPMTVGRAGSITGNEWNGWIDEFHLFSGALWTSTFTPPTAAWSSNLHSQTTTTDDGPIIIRFGMPIYVSQLRIDFHNGGAVQQMAVVYTGLLLTMERSIKIDTGHVPINLGRRTNMVNGMSENGNFLGRIVLNQHSESKASFSYMTQDFYRDEVDPFVIAAKEIPFFWAWNPTENPTDVGYAWLVSDPMPEIDPVTRRVSFDLDMRGVTE